MSNQKRTVPDEKITEFREALVREAERRGYFYDKYTGYDLTDEKAREEFLASAVHEECFKRCGKVAEKVAEILSESV